VSKAAQALPRTVIVLGLVSFFTDLSSEMIYPLLPMFLAGALAAGAVSLGLIEGVAESTASLLKVFSGIWSDRFRSRKVPVLAGYGLSSLVRPLIGLAWSWPVVLVMRFSDRIGKGVRTSPRDALLADVTEPAIRGRAYGLHRSMDHAGSVVGPLAAAALLALGLELRSVFLLAALPGIVVIFLVAVGIKERRAAPAAQAPDSRLPTSPSGPSFSAAAWKSMSPDFKRLMLALLVFTLGNSTDAFLLLRLSGAGFAPETVALLWSGHSVVKMVSTYFGGRLSDRLGYRGMIAGGWLLYALVYLAFGVVSAPWALVSIFMVYGVYFGLTEPAEKAWVASLVPPDLRGTAFGFYHGTIGLAALPASLVFGILWHVFGAPVAFGTGAALAAVALGLIARMQFPSHSSR